MKKWKARENFMDLVIEVSKHDKEAALYLLEYRHSLDVTYESLSLAGLFIWEDSKQGRAFWANLNKLVGVQ